ncbi:MAG: hypothetical protein LBO65_05700 [Spirochaetaceae bacterium]|jgi:hypothetical protein|nr:hypothetical protein [Spirochaetaceae bacterium]
MRGSYPVLFLAVFLPVLSACVTGDLPKAPPVTGELYFVPRILPNLAVPSETGARSEDPLEEAGELGRAFRDAYAEALIRGLPLGGVLGSDRVNPWPEDVPEGWTQNWVSLEKEANSWGVPGLVLALRNYAGGPGSPVYSVYGKVLHQYGISAGINRANGAAGYGIPLGELEFSQGNAIQRFTKGIIQIDRNGSRFISQGADSPWENPSPGERSGEFSGRDIPPEVGTALAFAWDSAAAGGDWISDGPVLKAAFSNPWILPSEGGDISVTGVYLKSCNQGKDVLVVVESPELPLRAHRLSDPVLSVLKARTRLPGLDRENSLGRSTGGNALVQSLSGGFALYGPPLSDVLPWPLDEEYDKEYIEAAEKKETLPLFKGAQRFGRGWIVIKPPPIPESAAYEEPAADPLRDSSL